MARQEPQNVRSTSFGSRVIFLVLNWSVSHTHNHTLVLLMVVLDVLEKGFLSS